MVHPAVLPVALTAISVAPQVTRSRGDNEEQQTTRRRRSVSGLRQARNEYMLLFVVGLAVVLIALLA